MLVGLLAVDPHRLYLYWELPGSHGCTMTLWSGGRGVAAQECLPSAGGVYVERLEAGRIYQAEFTRRARVVARSNEAALPPDGAPAALPPPALPAKVLPSSPHPLPSSGEPPA